MSNDTKERTADVLLGRVKPVPTHVAVVDIRPGDVILRMSDADREVFERCAAHEGFNDVGEWVTWALLHHALIVGTRDADETMQIRAGEAMNERWKLAG